jgi:hypothetical protein
MNMSTAARDDVSESARLGNKLRDAFISALLALSLFAPKVFRVRQNESSWAAFRIALGLAGAVLVVFPLGLWNSYLLAVLGLAMFVTAILLPSARPDTRVADKVRELGARAVLNGGELHCAGVPAAAVQLFVGKETIWALDSGFQTVLVIPVVEVLSVSAEQSESACLMRIRWANQAAEFVYRGIFAERLSRVAEDALSRIVPAPAPEPAKRRAATA